MPPVFIVPAPVFWVSEVKLPVPLLSAVHIPPQVGMHHPLDNVLKFSVDIVRL